MSESNYKLYARSGQLYFNTIESAQQAAKDFMPSKVELRIEILIDISVGTADFYAYEYEYKARIWVAS